ncbi:MAG: threonylcarbamoyl-AMP synthase [Lachnospiraceae bacterium]|nr:threonylcarbamoyl-AMP synthase [Lachnospiraceae bacterium]
MKTEVFRACGDERDSELMERAGRIIREGGLVAFPTETVYGLGGDALNPMSARKIYAAKGRPSDNPLIVHIADTADIEYIAESDERVPLLARHFWPGPLTVVVRKKDIVPFETTGGLKSVAVRFPSHPVSRSFISRSGGFIAAPSANLSGRPSCTRAEHVLRDLDGKIPLIIDGGKVGIGLESTIVDLTGEEAVLLRPGFYSVEELREVLGDIRIDPAVDGTEHLKGRPRAPGMKYRHYAPGGELTVFSGEERVVRERILAECRKALENRSRSGILCRSSHKAFYEETGAFVIPLGEDGEEIAKNLFGALRTMDERNIESIYSEAFEEGPLGMAIMNRLKRAAGGRIIICNETLKDTENT